jgi:hypothetical protein
MQPCFFELCGSVAGRRGPGIAAALVQVKDAVAEAWYVAQGKWRVVPAG